MILFVGCLLLLLNEIFGRENFFDAAILLSYDDDNYSQGCAQMKEVLSTLTKDHNLQSYKTDDDSRSSNTGVVEVGYDLYVFDIRYQHFLQLFNQSKKFLNLIESFLMI